MNDFILWLQTKLNNSGIDPGPLDGLDGTKTRNAVESLFSKIDVKPQITLPKIIVLDESFFDSVRSVIFARGLTQKAVDYMNALCDAFNKYGDGDRKKLAYIMATANREGNWKYDYEIWGPTAQQKRYEYPNALAKRLGNIEPGDGYKFRGRGFGCMITGRDNYKKYSEITGENLIDNPDLAARKDIAARICVEGSMMGTFTEKKLGDYINTSKTDYVNCRRVINSLDHAHEIAEIAEYFEKALFDVKHN